MRFAVLLLLVLLPLSANAQPVSWPWPAKQSESGQGPWPKRTIYDRGATEADEPYGNYQNSKEIEAFRNRVSGQPLSLVYRSSHFYYDGEGTTCNYDRWFPLTPQGGVCEGGGGTYPTCSFGSGGFCKTNTAASSENFYKSGTSQTGAAWGYNLECSGPGDCFGLHIGGYSSGGSPAGGDEAFVPMGVRVRDYADWIPRGTLTASLTAGSTLAEVSNQFKERARALGEHGYIVFNDTSAPNYSSVDGGDGAGTGTGGIEDFVVSPSSKWVINDSNEIPSAVRYDPTIGWTGYCFTPLKSARETDSTTYYTWLPILFGPTDTAAGTGADTVCGGSSCANNEMETYDPVLGLNKGARPWLVPGKVWTDYATDSATDDGVIAPCEIVKHPVYTLDDTGHIAPNSATKIVLRKPSKSGRTIASGTAWVYSTPGTNAQYFPLKITAERRASGVASMVSAIPLCNRPEECIPFEAGFNSSSWKSSVSGRNGLDHHFRAYGRPTTALLSYYPGVEGGSLSNVMEAAPMLYLSANTGDWGDGTYGNRIPIVDLGSNTATGFKQLYDSSDKRWLHSRAGAISQVAEVRDDPVVYFVPSGSRDCSDVCEARQLVCDSWKLISNTGALSNQTDCETNPTEQGAYCHCDSPET